MENPASWGRAERVVHQAHRDWEYARSRGLVGASLPMQVCNALRRAGLLRDEAEGETLPPATPDGEANTT